MKAHPYASIIRFIPTRVGNTVAGGLSPLPIFGSSPRAWGTPLSTMPPCSIQWFIPTRVGNTTKVTAYAPIASVHPHARGEHSAMMSAIAGSIGSSPRAWGTLRPALHRRREYRFIPTRVGNTKFSRAQRRLKSVHPHARGEHARKTCHHRRARFIPTRVGNTAIAWCS